MKNNTPILTNVDVGLREPVRQLISVKPEDRLDEHEFLKVRHIYD